MQGDVEAVVVVGKCMEFLIKDGIILLCLTRNQEKIKRGKTTRAFDMFKPIKRQRVSDEIVDQVKNLISQGKLKPGDRLPPERELIEEFGVSRPSHREALNSLVAQGFLEVKQGNRTFVKSITSEKLQDPRSLLLKADTQKIFHLIEVRKAMETWGAFHAAQRVTEEDIERLEEVIGEMKEALDEGRSWEKQDVDFTWPWPGQPTTRSKRI